MKNKSKIFLFVLMIFVFTFGTSAVAFAYTGYPTTFEQASSVFYSYFSAEMPSAKPVALVQFDSKVFLIVDKSVGTRPFHDLNFFKSMSNDSLRGFYHPLVLEFSYENFFSKPIIKYDGVDSSYGDEFISSNLGFNFANFQSGKFSFIYSVVDVHDYDGKVVFQKGTSQSPNPNPETPPSIPGSNSLSNLLNKNSAMLNGVLNEIIALLPLLLPVLITFLAIRKGIKFILQTLRSS